MASFRPDSSTTSATGVIIAWFERAGAIEYVSMAKSEVMARFALENATEVELARRDKLAREASVGR
jgi:hypothetical protein